MPQNAGVSWVIAVLHKEAIESEWLAVTYDKLLFLLAMRGQGLPVPDVRAIFHPGRNFADAACLNDTEAVARWLREDAAYPFFSKPVESTGSAGTASIDAFDVVADELVAADGRRVSVEQFSREVGRYHERGYLFQERIATHPEIAPVCGLGVSACRMLVRMGDGKPVLHRATWKIPAGVNMADNFWRDGNMPGALDPETGEVIRVVRGIAVDAVEVDIHPDTGKALKGYRLPEWEALKETCLKAAANASRDDTIRLVVQFSPSLTVSRQPVRQPSSSRRIHLRYGQPIPGPCPARPWSQVPSARPTRNRR